MGKVADKGRKWRVRLPLVYTVRYSSTIALNHILLRFRDDQSFQKCDHFCFHLSEGCNFQFGLKSNIREHHGLVTKGSGLTVRRSSTLHYGSALIMPWIHPVASTDDRKGVVGKFDIPTSASDVFGIFVREGNTDDD